MRVLPAFLRRQRPRCARFDLDVQGAFHRLPFWLALGASVGARDRGPRRLSLILAAQADGCREDDTTASEAVVSEAPGSHIASNRCDTRPQRCWKLVKEAKGTRRRASCRKELRAHFEHSAPHRRAYDHNARWRRVDDGIGGTVR